MGAGRGRTEGRELERDEDRTDGRESVRWEVDLDLETEDLDWLRGARLVTDPRDPDEDREPDRWRVKDPEGPVRLGRVTNDGWDEVRLREPLETFPGAATGGLDNCRLLRLVKDPLGPDEDRERLRLGAVERVDCGARAGVRTTFTPDCRFGRESGRCRTNDLVDPVRSERVTAGRREGTREPLEPLLATLERREPLSTRRSRVRAVDRDSTLEERTPLREYTAFGPRPRGRRSSLGSPSRKLPTMELDATTRVLPGPLPKSRPRTTVSPLERSRGFQFLKMLLFTTTVVLPRPRRPLP